MFTEYIGALFFIFAAEMGDKTQILAMMFATKYKTSKVLLGICIGSFLNHGLAVIFGTLLGEVINPNILQVVAGLAFIGFAFWTLLGKEGEDEEEKQSSKGAIITVAAAFFVGELGDKTQLTAITLSVDAMYPFLILLGTVSGMVVTSSIGIFVGSKVGDKIPELMIKILSGSIFMLFGVLKLANNTPDKWIQVYTVIPFILLISLGVIYVLRLTIIGIRSGELTPLRYAAKLLYDLKNENKGYVEALCKTTSYCGSCSGESCGIGLIRHIIEDIDKGDLDYHHEAMVNQIQLEKDKFNHEKLVHMLESNIAFLLKYKQRNAQYFEVDQIRKVIEILLIGEWIEFDGSKEGYLEKIGKVDVSIYNELNL